MPRKTNRRTFLKTTGVVALGSTLGLPVRSGQTSVRNYWVSTTGDDNDSGTECQPFRTVQKAVDTAQPGDTIYVSAGRYIEQVIINTEKGGKDGRWLTISCAPGEDLKAVIGPDRPHVDKKDSALATPGGTQYLRLKGLSFMGCYRSAGGAINISKSQHVEIINCQAFNSGAGGVDANNCDYITIDGVEAFFNGGGSAWSSGISLLEPASANNFIRNCRCYGNYDWSSYRTDGNGIIIDWTHNEGAGCTVTNNLCYMNGGLGMASTGSDNVLFINNTSVANSWQDTRRNDPSEIAVRGNNNLVRNNIGVAVLDRGTGLLVLNRKPGGRIPIDYNSIIMDHNLWWNPKGNLVTFLAGEEVTRLTIEQLREKFPKWSKATVNTDPGFNDMENLDFRLRPGSAVLNAGIADKRVTRDITGRRRPANRAISIGCFEGSYVGKSTKLPEPKVVIAEGEDVKAINILLTNEYSLEWNGMLWGWGQQLYEDLPLIVDVEGPRKADFLDIYGNWVLNELLEKIAREHNVRLVLRQPSRCKGIGTGPEVISERLKIHKEANAEEMAHIRSTLRAAIWTQDTLSPSILADQWPAFQIALGLKINTNKPIPSDARFQMITQNLKLDAFLYDLAERLDMQFTLSILDAKKGKDAIAVESNVPFGGEDGLVEMTIGKSNRSDNQAEINIFARFGEKEAIRARVTSLESFLMTVEKDKLEERGHQFNRGATRQVLGKPIRMAVVGKGCALNISDRWILLAPVPEGLESGNFLVRLKEAGQVNSLRFMPVDTLD